MQKVFVTGAGGFIGSHLIEALVIGGHRVRALVRYNGRSCRGHLDRLPPDVLQSVDIHLGDVTDSVFIKEFVAGCDVGFHLAALIGIPYSYHAPASYVSVNVNGTLNILEACRRVGVKRLLVTSTSEVYGTARYTPINEDHSLQGQSPYSATKIGADKLAEAYYCSFNLPVTIVRPFNTYGPRQSARAIVPTIAAQLAAKLPALRLGSLWPERDLTFVEDIAAGFLSLAQCDDALGQVVNLGSGRSISVGRLAEKMIELSGSRVQIHSIEDRARPTKSEVGLLLADTSKAARLTGWSAKTPLMVGLARTLEYVAANLHDYRPTEYQI